MRNHIKINIKNKYNYSDIIVVVLLFFLNFSTFEAYFTHDSFHYMHLSLFPVAGDSHPLLFGFILKITNDIGRFLNIQLFALHSLIFIQSFLATISLIYIYTQIKKLYLVNTNLVLKIFVVLTFLLIAISFYIFKSAVWTEIFYLSGLLFCFLRVKKMIQMLPKLRLADYAIDTGVIFIFSGILYHLRYQSVVLTIACFVILSVVVLIKCDQNKLFKFSILLVFLTINLFIMKLPSIYFENIESTKFMANSSAKTSYLCFWRCSSNLISKTKECKADSAEINNYSCSNILIGDQKFPIHPNNYNFNDILVNDGIINIFVWFIFSPIKYIFDQHTLWGLEIGRFRYQDDDASNFYKDAGVYFKNQFNRESAYKSSFYSKIENLLFTLHFKYKLFNLFVGVFLIIFLFNIRKIFLFNYFSFIVLNFFGTLYLFSTLNPHTPWRFLVQLLFIGILGVCCPPTKK